MRRIIYIIRKEWLLEFRKKHAFLSSILYLAAITFVVFKVFGSLEGPTKTGLFWVIYLFTCINIVGNSFSYQSMRRKYLYYQLYDPVELLIAKILFNFLKLVLAGLILLFLQTIFSGESLINPGLFMKSFFLAAFGLTVILTMISAISSFSENQNALVAILALPLVIPVLLLGMRISLVSERFFSDPAVGKYLSMIAGIDLLLLSLSLIFIPVIWKS